MVSLTLILRSGYKLTLLLCCSGSMLMGMHEFYTWWPYWPPVWEVTVNSPLLYFEFCLWWSYWPLIWQMTTNSPLFSSCGGNMLVNVGPTHDGLIDPIYEERLRQLGSWLQVNGEAIYKSRPWTFQNDTVTRGIWWEHEDFCLPVSYSVFTEDPSPPTFM